MVACDPRDSQRHYKSYPKVLIEVLSPDTERIDRREKFLSYIQIETLEEYVLLAQDRLEVTVFRRATQWAPEMIRQPEALLHTPRARFYPAAPGFVRKREAVTGREWWLCGACVLSRNRLWMCSPSLP